MVVLNYGTNFRRAKYCDNTAELHIGNMSDLVLTEVGGGDQKNDRKASHLQFWW